MLPKRRFLILRLLWAALSRPIVLGFLAIGLIPAAVLIGPALAQAWTSSPLAVPFYAAFLIVLAAVFGCAAFLTVAFLLLSYKAALLLRGLARYGREQGEGRWAEPITAPTGPELPAPTPEDLAREEAYNDLGLPYGAEPSAVKASYRRLARSLHPDVSQAPDAAERFRRVQAAYDLLTSTVSG